MWPNPGLGLSWAVCTAQYGGLDIMVANAGIVKGADFLDMTEEDFDAVINVNLKGVFLVRPAHLPLPDQRLLLCSLKWLDALVLTEASKIQVLCCFAPHGAYACRCHSGCVELYRAGCGVPCCVHGVPRV